MSLILLPGLDGTGLLFQPLIAALPARISAVAVRYPGDRRLNYSQLQALVTPALPRSEPFVLLGESFSGPLAVMIAAQRPKNLAGVILCASFVTAPRRFIRPAVSVFARAPAFHFYPAFKRIRARIFGFSTPPLRALLAEMEKQVRPQVIAARVRMVFQVDVRDALAACAVPMLYLQATRDRLVSPRSLRVIQSIKPEIQVAKIASSHMVLQRCATQSAELIARFAFNAGN